MNITLKEFLIFSLVFALSFLWIFSLTYNFNFFWEDSEYLRTYERYQAAPENYTVSAIASQLLGYLVDPQQFYNISYTTRPLSLKFPRMLPLIFGTEILYYRIFNALLFSLLITLFFSFFYKINKAAGLCCSFLLTLYILVLPETWMFSVYLIEELVQALLFSTLALGLFFFFYRNPMLKNKILLTLLFFAIVFFTHLAILIKHVGRINFLIIFLFLLFIDKKKLTAPRHAILILSLFTLSVPIISFIALFKGSTLLEILGLTATHAGVQAVAQESFILLFLKTFPLAFLPHAFFLTLLLFVFMLLHVIGKKSIKEDVKEQQKEEEKDGQGEELYLLKEFALFSFLWFLLAAAGMYIARGFDFPSLSFLRFEFSLFIVPQALFIVSYAFWVYKKFFPSKQWMRYVIYGLLILAILHNTVRLNEWRGGWGAYFLGYDTVRAYVDDHASHALLLTAFDHGMPTYFVSNNNNTLEMFGDFNSTFFDDYLSRYSTVFIVARYPIDYNSSMIARSFSIPIQDNSPYGLLKRSINKAYPSPMYIYELQKVEGGDYGKEELQAG